MSDAGEYIDPEEIADESRFADPDPEPDPEAGRPFQTGNPLVDGLWNTEPNPPLDAVESPFDLERGGLPRLWRGVQKWLGVDGAYAAVDIALGALEFVVQRSQGAESDGGDGATVSVGGDWGE